MTKLVISIEFLMHISGKEREDGGEEEVYLEDLISSDSRYNVLLIGHGTDSGWLINSSLVIEKTPFTGEL